MRARTVGTAGTGRKAVALVGAGLALLAVAVAVAVAVAAVSGTTLAHLPVLVAGASGEEVAIEVYRVEEVDFPPGPGRPVFLLVLGDDARPGEDGARADAIHLIGVNPGTGRATILNIPRDTWVDIPEWGWDKINASLVVGGPELTARTVGALVGVDIPFVLVTRFEGVVSMVDELGGLTVDVPFDMADDNSGAYFEAGPQLLDGEGVLAFSRNRHLPGGDFTRTYHQSLVIIAALAKLRAEGMSPGDTFRYLTVLRRHVSLHGLSLGDLYRLGRLGLSLDPANIRSVTMPGYGGWAGEASVVYVAEEAAALFADFADDGVLESF